MLSPAKVAALTRAILLDQVRAPAFGVAAALIGALLALQPRLGNPAAGIADNVRLALELSVSSLVLAAGVWAGVRGAAALGRLAEGGPLSELLVLPGGAPLVMWGSWAGTTAAAYVLVVASGATGLLGWIGAPGHVLEVGAAEALPLLLSMGAGVAVAAALGVFYAASSNRVLAVLLFLAHVVVVRVARVESGDSPEAGWLALLPDPAPVDAARDLAHRRGLGWESALLGAAAAAVQVMALLALAREVLRARTAGRAEGRRAARPTRVGVIQDGSLRAPSERASSAAPSGER